MVTLFYQTAIDHVYFYKIEFAKLIIRYPAIFSGTGKYLAIYNTVLAFMVSDFVVMLADVSTSD